MKLFVLSFITMMGLSLSVHAEAVKLSYTISNIGDGTKIYYSCDVVEDMVENMLETLGATDIKTRCFSGTNGAIDWFLPLSVSVEFQKTNFSETQHAEFMGETCYLAHETFHVLKKTFAVTNVDKNHCRYGFIDRYTIIFDFN